MFPTDEEVGAVFGVDRCGEVVLVQLAAIDDAIESLQEISEGVVALLNQNKQEG